MPLPLFQKLVIATHNAGKVKEFARLINHNGLVLVSAGELGLPEPEETGKTFAENAKLKALAAARAAGLPALADDSGLSVDALSGAPGIYSARWAGPNKDFTPAFLRIENELRAKSVMPTGTNASFFAALCLALPDGACVESLGECKGTLTFPPRGEYGFGYDPIFIPEGYTQTFAEMPLETKEKISHRTQAFVEMKEKLAFA